MACRYESYHILHPHSYYNLHNPGSIHTSTDSQSAVWIGPLEHALICRFQSTSAVIQSTISPTQESVKEGELNLPEHFGPDAFLRSEVAAVMGPLLVARELTKSLSSSSIILRRLTLHSESQLSSKKSGESMKSLSLNHGSVTTV